jgi:DNA-binding NarL/FixJ family response regulator
MNIPSRILLLEPNRYRALLLHRALENRMPETICVRFNVAEPALEEIGRGIYAGVVLNLDSVTAAQAGRLSVELQHRPSTPIVLLASPETSRRSLAAMADVADSVLMSGAADPDQIAEQLELRLSRPCPVPSEKPVRTISYRYQLTLNGE